MMSMFFCGVVFFKQKTAYEMRISGWSADVCSSDLAARDGFSLFLSMGRSGRAWAMDLVGSLSFREWCGSRGPVNLREELSVFSSLFLPLSAVAYPVGPQRRMAEKPDIDHSAQLSRKARVN